MNKSSPTISVSCIEALSLTTTEQDLEILTPQFPREGIAIAALLMVYSIRNPQLAKLCQINCSNNLLYNIRLRSIDYGK